MKISARQEINAPQQTVFDALSDAARYEHKALRRGVTVRRLDDGSGGIAQADWELDFDYRGRRRLVTGRMAAYSPPNLMVIDGKLEGLEIVIETQVSALAPDKTQVIVGIDLRPTTLTARLLVQSLRLAKKTMTARLKKRLLQFADQIEAAHSA